MGWYQQNGPDSRTSQSNDRGYNGGCRANGIGKSIEAQQPTIIASSKVKKCYEMSAFPCLE